MKIAVACCTYRRPKSLGQMIACFEAQDYPADLRELVILDDAGQYDDQRGDGWRLHSIRSRFRTLGEKRNAVTSLVSPDTEAIAIWDDDDIYLPWALSATAAVLTESCWSRPGQVLVRSRQNHRIIRKPAGSLFHGGWGYRINAFHAAGGYPAMNNGEDQAFARRMRDAGYESADPCQSGFAPFYLYQWKGGQHNLSGMGPRGYEWLGRSKPGKAKLLVRLPEKYDEIVAEQKAVTCERKDEHRRSGCA